MDLKLLRGINAFTSNPIVHINNKTTYNFYIVVKTFDDLVEYMPGYYACVGLF